MDYGMAAMTLAGTQAATQRKRTVKVFRGRGYKRRASFTTTPFGKRVSVRRAKNKVARASRKFNRQRAAGKR